MPGHTLLDTALLPHHCGTLVSAALQVQGGDRAAWGYTTHLVGGFLVPGYTYSGVVVGVWLAGKAAGDDWDLSVGTLLFFFLCFG